MMILSTASGAVNCRSVSVPACDPHCDSGQSTGIPSLAVFQIRIRDTVDFTVDFTEWLQANGNATLSGATFAAASDSPSAPSIQGQSFNASGKAMVVLSGATEGVQVGNAFWIDVTAQVAATVALLPSDLVIPARTLVRRIHVVVISG